MDGMTGGLNPLMIIQAALERPELVAAYLAAQGKVPPTAEEMAIQTASGPRGPVPADTTGGVPPQSMPPQTLAVPPQPAPAAAPAAPAASQLAPLTQQLMAQQPSGGAAPAPAARTFSPPTNFQTGASMTPTPVAGAAPAEPGFDWAGLSAALAGVAPSVAGGGAPARIPFAPAPFISQALNPQTLQILQQALTQPAVVPSLGAMISGGR